MYRSEFKWNPIRVEPTEERAYWCVYDVKGFKGVVSMGFARWVDCGFMGGWKLPPQASSIFGWTEFTDGVEDWNTSEFIEEPMLPSSRDIKALKKGLPVDLYVLTMTKEN